MCLNCVLEEYPDRDTVCLEDGSYYVNFKECSSCHTSSDVINVCNRREFEEGDEEVVVYEHVCKLCNHQIAEHTYCYKPTTDFQEYEMSCMLCGMAEDKRSVMPYDPRKNHIMLS